MSVEIGKVKGTYTFKAVLNKITGQESLGYDMNDIYKISVSVEMPGKLKAYSEGEAADNKVVFKIKDLSKENEIYAESTTGSSIPALIVTVLIVGGIAAVFFMRKKKSR